ncbi:hypothetical protein O181_129632 [Austropuccinia psidii MF-1]|uniref:Uncharacterized protein n=1 Tax=Austropuccinia psidii MF-1 TaxID=1389203 RepID=A0A9Q3KZL7_9BASI|nr:hypothetical protein [Austropuccinia psidii MF-1]
MVNITWFRKQQDRLSALHPDMSYSIMNMTNLRKFGVELKHAIKCRFLEPYSAEHFIDEMEDIITRTIIGRTWTRNPMESKIISKTSMVDRRPEKPVLKWYKCGSTSHLANNFTKKTKINEVQ